ncbi:MAG: endonuclease domain-containing protein [Novosphingobium sp.]
MKKHPPSLSIVHARDLRRNPTEAEKAMWVLLKKHFPEERFRRQVPIRHYIGDFTSHRLRTMIEIDGDRHSAESDATRTRTIDAEGYSVVRFWNNDVLENPEGCMTRLGQLLS